jgi:hypothetical protein
VVRAVSEEVTRDASLVTDATVLAKLIQQIYRSHRNEVIDQEVLAPNMLSRRLWSARPATMQPLPEAVVKRVQANLRDFLYAPGRGFSCDLLFCGFDGHNKPNIIDINDYSSVARNITIIIGQKIIFPPSDVKALMKMYSRFPRSRFSSDRGESFLRGGARSSKNMPRP